MSVLSITQALKKEAIIDFALLPCRVWEPLLTGGSPHDGYLMKKTYPPPYNDHEDKCTTDKLWIFKYFKFHMI